MQPPWEVEPEIHADKFWIVTRSDYRDGWRSWFCSLPEFEQTEYRRLHQPPESCSQFYSVFGRPTYDPEESAERHRDNDGDLAPPWLAFPKIGLGSIGWRMGSGEDYWIAFDRWFKKLPPDHKRQFRLKYPEPERVEQGLPWTGFYDRKESE